MTPYYDQAGITIYHGDCRDVLADLEQASVDLLLTDPPYGMQYAGRGAASSQANVSGDGVRQGMRVLRQAMFATSPLLKDDAHALIFCHWQSWPDFYDAICPYLKIRNALIWDKATSSMGNIHLDYQKSYEVILYGGRGQRDIGGEGSYSSVLRGFSRVNGVGRSHPTEKPVSLLRYLVPRHAPPGALVIDPFMGTGATLVAAKDLGRRAIGIELEERYCEIAAKRMGQEVLDFGGAA